MNSHLSGPRPVSIILLAAACTLVSARGSAAQDRDDHDHDHDRGGEFAQHAAHEHGKVTFHVAVEGQQLVVELDAPAGHVIGFEHAPRTEAQKAKVRDQAAWLQAGRNLITVPAAAACRFREAKLEAPQWKEGESHADYEVHLTYQCDQPQRLDWLQLTLLGGLQDVQEARVNLLTPARQGSQTVKSAETRVKLR